MPALERFQLNSRGMGELLRSKGVRDLLQSKANKVADAVKADMANEDGDWRVFADTQIGKTRAGATVHGVPMRVEADRRVLGRALDAARE